MLHRRSFLASFAGTAALAALPARVRAAEVVLKVHHFLPATSTTQKFIALWAERISRQSGGRIAFTLHPSMELGGKPPQLYDQVRDGVVDVIWTLPGYTAGRFPRAEVVELPFVAAASAEANSQAVHAFAMAHLREEFGDVHPLMVHAHEAGVFHLRKRPIKRLEDLKGAKIRAPSRVVNDVLAALGATAVGMPVPQVPEALSRGVIDGALLPFEVTGSLRVPELTDSNTEIAGPRGLYTAVFLFAMNRQRYEALPQDLRAIIDANSGADLARQVGRMWDEAEAQGRAAAVKAGHAFHRIEGEELARWQSAAEPVTTRWLSAMADKGIDGKALLDGIRAEMARFAGG
ncbi:MAG TPA: TRAP transporter substrate-binding protein [Azospirillaceae bacterium]|nr:TRAP transporter substrate-binding protein [Azospirillaceae bacterium]